MGRVQEENADAAAVNDAGNSNNQNQDVAVADAGTLAWSGFLLVALPFVAASWAGLVDEPVEAFLAFTLLLFGVAFIILAMGSPAKPKMT